LLDGRDKRASAGVVDRDELRDERLGRLAVDDVGVAVNGYDARDGVLGRGEALTLENGAKGDIPRLVADLGGDRALHIPSHDDGAAREGRERRDHIMNVGFLERDGNRRLLRLLHLLEQRDCGNRNYLDRRGARWCRLWFECLFNVLLRRRADWRGQRGSNRGRSRCHIRLRRTCALGRAGVARVPRGGPARR